MDIKSFTTEVYRQLDLAIAKFDLPITRNMVNVRCDVKGRVAGWAIKKSATRYEMRFNREAIEKYTDKMVKDTVPHEIAHIVCYVKPSLGSSHDAGWKAVCRALGGDDSRTHHMKLTPGKAVNKHIYMVDGLKVQVGPKVHKAIQTGARSYHVKANKQPMYAHQWIGSTNPEPVQQAAREPNQPRTPTPRQGLTKRQIAESIVAENPVASRGEIIQMFIDQAGMTKAGAATYYYNIKNGK